MSFKSFWNEKNEIEFFEKNLQTTTKEKLFYKIDNEYIAYIPKGKEFHDTLQSRNSLIGNFTEKWVKEFLEPIAKEKNLFCINGVICEELGLSKKSPADIAFCTTNEIEQKEENIKAIFEVKMSIVNNYKLKDNDDVVFYGDWTEHKGNPSLFRSDSILKAIGKSVNIRLKNKNNFIPIFVLGNTFIKESYKESVDNLKDRGIIQGFINLYPEIKNCKLKKTEKKGFITFSNYNELKKYLFDFLDNEYIYISKALKKQTLQELLKENIEDFLQKLKEIND